jgi:cytoskeleton protein RodZ
MSEAVPIPAMPGEPGPQLKAQREKRGMSVQKAADELHLDGWVIEALESGDYARIGPTVYAKGHLKRYAGLLGLPPAGIMAGYETRAPAPTAVTLTAQSARMASRGTGEPISNLSPGTIVGGLLAGAVLLGVLWWKPWHQRVAAPQNPPHVASLPQAAADPKEDDSAAAAATASLSMVRDSARASAAATPIATSLTSSADAAATASSTAGAGRARLRLSFSADSWVDVHDALGKRVYAGNGLANSVKALAGVAPMRVYLGAGSGVQLEINDRAVAIGPQFFSGDVARFEAGADGVLRRDQAHGAPSSSAQTRNTRPPG